MALIEEFFDKSRYTISKLTDQIEFTPGVLFTLPTRIEDSLKATPPVAVSAVLIKTVGRVLTILPTVVTVSNPSVFTYTFSATPALLDWDGTVSLHLKTIIDGVNVLIPLVVKG